MGNKYKAFAVTCGDFYSSKSEKQDLARSASSESWLTRHITQQGVTRRNSLSHHSLS
jgi:hypothetical protein